MKVLHAFVGAIFAIGALGGFSAGAARAAAPAPSASPAKAPATPDPDTEAQSAGLTPYAKFTQGMTAEHGLFTIWRGKQGNVAFELRPDQLNKDYIGLIVPVNGIGIASLFSGTTDLGNCKIIRFVQQDNHVAILLPQTVFTARPGSPEALAVAAGTTNSLVGVAKVLSIDQKTGDVVFDASPLLQDVADVSDDLTATNGGTTNPLASYRMDPQQSYFTTLKAFPNNVVLDVAQTFSTLMPQTIDTVPDARNIQVTMQYNIAEIPKDDGYMPRLMDERVGFFSNAHDDFTNDDYFDKRSRYVVRFNVQPSDPNHLSPAKNPIVYYLSNTIPYRYRQPIRDALLTWNQAFAKIGIANAIVVKDQPTNDSTWDPDDIRYNVIRWLTLREGGFAEAELVYNPYDGEMVKAGVVIDGDIMRYQNFQYPIFVQPDRLAQNARRALDDTRTASLLRSGALYSAGERAQFTRGITALTLRDGGSGYVIPQWFANKFLQSVVLHESGHDLGLRHNFIGSEAYTAKELQSKAFTARYGTASSVMEYSPMNIWPKGMPQGDFFQTVLGPYDYYAIKWGYARIPNAKTPQDEVATLNRWASNWSDPRLKYLSDEDVAWGYSAVDPTNQQFDLTNDTIGWCQAQMNLDASLLKRVDRRFPHQQAPFDDLRTAVFSLVGNEGQCGIMISRFVGGELVSRALRGDRRAALPLSPIAKSEEQRAFNVLAQHFFAADASNISPTLSRELVTQYQYDDWHNTIVDRHDVSIAGVIGAYQSQMIAQMFSPTTLTRLDEAGFKYQPGSVMGLSDLFAWMQASIYSDLSHPKGGNIPLVRRNLQRNYTALLTRLANQPYAGAPPDAQALARYELGALDEQLQRASKNASLDMITRAHIAALASGVSRALHAQTVIPAINPLADESPSRQ